MVRRMVTTSSERERDSCSCVVVKRQRIASEFVLVHNEIWDRIFL